MIKATKVRIYPTPEQAEFLNRQFGAVRFAYNKALHIISSQYKRHGTKHIADASWTGLIQKQEYKAKEQGKHLIKIDPWFASTKTCTCCGHKLVDLPLTIRQWQCPACTAQNDRGINAALNIKAQGILKLKAEGLSVSANGGKRQSGHAPVAA